MRNRSRPEALRNGAQCSQAMTQRQSCALSLGHGWQRTQSRKAAWQVTKEHRNAAPDTPHYDVSSLADPRSLDRQVAWCATQMAGFDVSFWWLKRDPTYDSARHQPYHSCIRSSSVLQQLTSGVAVRAEFIKNSRFMGDDPECRICAAKLWQLIIADTPGSQKTRQQNQKIQMAFGAGRNT